MTPKGSMGFTRLNEAHAADATTPARWFRMHEIGITTHKQLIAKTGTHLISNTDMQHTWGSKVQTAHKRTLNMISLIITATFPRIHGYINKVPTCHPSHSATGCCQRIYMGPMHPAQIVAYRISRVNKTQPAPRRRYAHQLRATHRLRHSHGRREPRSHQHGGSA